MKKRYGLRSYAVGATVARTGDDMSGPALLLAGLAVTGSPVAASSLLAALTVAAAIGGPAVGALLDRSPRPGRLLAAALAAYAAALGALALALGRLPLALTLPLAVAAGLLGPALSGGWSAQLPRIAGRTELGRAFAHDAMTFDLAGLAGPALAGAVAAWCGAPAAVIAAAVLICCALPPAWSLPPAAVLGPPPCAAGPDRPARPGRSGPRPTLRDDLAAGLRTVLRVRPLFRATLTTVISCAGEGMLVVCAPLLGEREFGAAHHGALLLPVVAVAALVANAALSRRPDLIGPDTVLGLAPLVLAVALAAAANAPHPAVLIAAMALAGAAGGPQLTALFAVRHRESPARVRAQVLTTGASLKLTAFALGAALAGPLAAGSVTAALLTAAALQLAAALAHAAVGPRPRRRTHDEAGRPTGCVGRPA